VDETSDQLGRSQLQVIVHEPKASLVDAEVLPKASKNAVLQNDFNVWSVECRDIEEGAAEASLKIRECLAGQVRIYLDKDLVT
jgi:hypothetical protein